MGGAFAHRSLETNQPAMEGVRNLEAYGQNVGLGLGGKAAKGIIKQMRSGDYSGLAGTLLSPIHDRYAAQGREMERNALMGGNALYAGTQPALMAGLQQETRRKMAESEGLAYGQAIPALFEQQQGVFQNALNARRGLEMAALQGGLQGRLQANQYITKPGWLSQVGGLLGGVAGAATGLAGLGGFGGSSLPPVTGPVSSNPSTYLPYAPSYSGYSY